MPRRHRNAFGTIRKKGTRHYAEYTGPDARRHTPGRSFATRTDANGWLAAERRLIDLDTWEPSEQRRSKVSAASLTVGEWLDKFHDNLQARPNPPRASTMQLYRRSYRNRITAPTGPGADVEDITRLAGLPLAKLTVDDVYRWWDAVQDTYPGMHTANQKAYARLRASTLEAEQRGMIDANPVKVPDAGRKVKPAEKYLPEDWEIDALLATVPARYRVLTSLVLHHGLRLGEALALEVRHVQVDEKAGVGHVIVEQIVQRLQVDGKTTMVVQPPKTQAGYRRVPILQPDLHLFVEHLERFAPGTSRRILTSEGERSVRLLTTTEAGNVMFDTSYRSVLGRARAAAGVNDGINPHTGRNWLITRLAENGAHLKEIGALLGQDDVHVILDVYMKVRAGRTDSVMRSVGFAIENG